MMEVLRALWGARMMRVPPLRGVLVLTYHGAVSRTRDGRLDRNFVSVEALDAQLAIIRRHRVIALTELEALPGGDTMAPAIALTVDDGLRGALPIAESLARARLPWALFTSTGPVARGGTIWTAELALLLLHGAAERVEVSGTKWDLRTRAAREETFRSIRTALKAMPADRRRRAMDEVRAAFPAAETERLLDAFPEFRSLSWDELRALHDAGVTIGSHGVEHELHHDRETEAERKRELAESRRTIEREIGAPCRYFSYPNGDTSLASAAEVSRAGYALAFGTQAGVISSGSDRFALPRVEAGGSAASLLQHMRRAMPKEIAS